MIFPSQFLLNQELPSLKQLDLEKSTIMRLLYRFYDTIEGRIFIDGQDISKMKIRDLRMNIAIVPQDCVLFNDTVRYNVAYGDVKDKKFSEIIENEEKREELLVELDRTTKRAKIYDFIQSKEFQYEEIVGERGLKLSGGEKQRVAIARALF